MKNTLMYQTTEYDCGPITLLNSIRFLFDREVIYPDIVKYITLYSLDTYNEEGELGKHGTTANAMLFLSNWLNQFSQIKKFPLSCEFLSGTDITLTQNSKIISALQQGGVVLLRLFLDVGHYVLLTGLEKESVYLFDPYYEEEDDPKLCTHYHDEGICFINDQPKRANRKVSIERLNRTGVEFYEMGPFELREAIIMFNKETQITPEKTIEYFI